MQHSSPLVSTLTIINSSSALNVTGIRCTEVVIVGDEFELAVAVSSTIQVIEDSNSQTGNYDHWLIGLEDYEYSGLTMILDDAIV